MHPIRPFLSVESGHGCGWGAPIKNPACANKAGPDHCNLRERGMDWANTGHIALTTLRYLKARLQEPTSIHRGVMAVGGIVGAFELTGPERWISGLIAIGNLLGVLVPDDPKPPVGFNEASPLPPIDLQGRSESPHGTPPAVSADRHSPGQPRAAAGRMRQSVQPPNQSRLADESGFNDR